MSRYILIVNKQSAKDKLIINLHYSSGYQILDWYGDNKSRQQYIDSGLPHPGVFPCLVDKETRIICQEARDSEKAHKWIDAVIKFRNASDTEKVRLQREEEYNSSGLTVEAWMKALIQKTIDNDTSEWDKLILKRNAIKERIIKK